MKPLLAEDYIENKLVFPLGAQPKIDGVRGLTTEGSLTGRSLKKHKNKYTTAFYSTPEYKDFDGELAAQSETHPDLCRITSSALSTIKGEPFTLWWLFDCLKREVIDGDYIDRYDYLRRWIEHEHQQGRMQHARLVPMVICHNIEELRAYHEENIDKGYEGTCIRALHGKHKQGRSTISKGELLRIKDFIEAEATVVSIVEGEKNLNEAQTNELGKTFRSSHQENKVPNGHVGNFQAKLVKDIVYGDKTLFEAGADITISPGNMDHSMRKHYFENQDEIVGKVVKFKFFPKGIKDKPRFPTFVCIRPDEDMSED